MSIQDRSAGNTGDQLKHALLLEVLDRIPADEVWGYVETHAGAGTYLTPHAPALFRGAWSETGGGAAGRESMPERLGPPAGWCYARALSRWWREQSAVPGLAPEHMPDAIVMEVSYPGSAVLALRSEVMRGPVALIESDPTVVRRLRIALDRLFEPARRPERDGWPGPSSRVQAITGSFAEHIDRFKAASRMVVLADPYFYMRESLACHEGQLGLKHLRFICQALDSRDAVLLVFASSPPSGMLTLGEAGALSGGTWKALLSDLRAQAPPALRCFRAAETPHAVLAAGWGAGKAIVRGLPGVASWERSWLAAPPLSLRVVEEAGR